MTAHELGHRIEREYVQIRNLERTFYERRTEGQAKVRLKDLFPHSNYGPEELTIPDDFVHAYIGRYYGRDTYEVLTEGLQAIFADYGAWDHWLIESDPDMFRFVLGLLALV